MHRLLPPLAALVAVLPLVLGGPSCGHDLDFHLLSWLEAARQLAHGTYPRWAYTPAYGAGEPRFLFYPPLSWLLGAALTAALPFAWVGTAYTWLCLTLSGLALRRLAAPYTSAAGATLAAIFYLTNPYMLFTAYERTAYGELLAAAILPWLFAAVLAPRLRLGALAIPLALLWLANAPAAVMASYALALFAVVRLITYRREGQTAREAFQLVSATALGLLLAAFYILPAAYERRWVTINLVVVAGLRPVDNFLFEHTPDPLHDQVLRTASTIAVLLLTLTAAALLALWRIRRPDPASLARRLLLPSLTVLTLAIAFLLIPLSAPLWRYLPELGFLQFPWRLLALLAPVLALALAVLARRLPNRTMVLIPAVTLLLGACVLPAVRVFRQSCDPEDAPLGRRAAYLDPAGTEPTDEYTPIDADEDALKPGDPSFWLAADPDAPAPAGSAPGSAPNHLTLTAPLPGYLILNRHLYPIWRLSLNDRPVAALPRQRPDGLMVLPVPAGPLTLDLHPILTPDQLAGDALSAIALCVLAVASLRNKAHPVNSVTRRTASYRVCPTSPAICPPQTRSSIFRA